MAKKSTINATTTNAAKSDHNKGVPMDIIVYNLSSQTGIAWATN
jgi:hypothetical protein